MNNLSMNKIRQEGFNAGMADVRGFFDENGEKAFLRATAPGQLGWDESAINADVAGIVLRTELTDKQREAFYEAYNEGAKEEESCILAEIKRT